MPGGSCGSGCSGGAGAAPVGHAEFTRATAREGQSLEEMIQHATMMTTSDGHQPSLLPALNFGRPCVVSIESHDRTVAADRLGLAPAADQVNERHEQRGPDNRPQYREGLPGCAQHERLG